MEYSERYKVDLVNALHMVDSVTVQRVIQCLKQARAHNRRVIICGSERGGTAGAQFLADTLKQAKPLKGQRLRVLNLNTQVTPPADLPGETSRDRLIVEELKAFAEPGDVVIAICGSRQVDSIVNALEYANWIHCRTIAVSGSDDARLAALSVIRVTVSASHSATLDDAVMAICHLIGCSFIDSCSGHASTAEP